MVEHDRLVQAVVRKQVLGSLSFAEALHAGRIGLWHAIMGYDPQRGLAFSTYAWPCIAHDIWAAVKAADRPPPLVLPSPSVARDDAASRMRCAFVQNSCYQPVRGTPAHRPCPATEGDMPHRGCACDSLGCAKTCLSTAQPRVTLSNVTYPPHECPYQADNHPHGQIRNLGERFADGSIRLARDLPVGTPAWERLYHRARNASESRHAILEGWGLKRLPVYGNLRGKALIFQADVWANLTTMTRLVREATLAASGP
jgi:hypothetical protein